MNRERLSGAYRLSAYYLAKITSEFIVGLAYPTLFWTITYFAVGFTLKAWNFIHLILATYAFLLMAMVGSYFVHLILHGLRSFKINRYLMLKSDKIRKTHSLYKGLLMLELGLWILLFKFHR